MSRYPVPVVAVSALVAFAAASRAAEINYSGQVFNESGLPLPGGFVIAGAFAPTFNPAGYCCFYGDPACNLDPGAYDRAVADGNFLPAGAGGFTDAAGFFSLTGTSAAQAGSPIWLFAFEDAGRNSFTQALASSSDPDWAVPSGAGVTSIQATEATTFVLGQDHPLGIALSVIPFPEPACASVLVAAVAGLCSRRRRV
jgi:hypothetical protein